MSYLTHQDIQLRIGTSGLIQLTDDAATGAVNEAVLESVRAAAGAEVDSHLGRRFAVPVDVLRFPEAGAVIRAVALDVIEYRLHARRPPIPDDVATRYRAAAAWLVQISEGNAALPAVAPLPAAAGAGIVAHVLGNPATLSRKTFEGT
jgi:phage gp36-like protein